MLELHIASVDASNGNIPVSWCLSKELIAHLEKKNLKDPAIVICVVPQRYSGEDADRNREYRKVVKLQDLMTYIELPFAGTNKLMAIVDDSRPFKEAKDTYMSLRASLRASGTSYAHDVLDYYNDEYRYRNDMCQAAPITLEVPNAIFAKEPPKWEKAWVNWLHIKKAANQCEFRRKRMFAYTVQPLLFLMSYIGQIVFSVAALLFGAKAFSFQPLLHPLTYNVDDKTISLFRKGSHFVGNGHTFWEQTKYIVFTPAVLLSLAMVLSGNRALGDIGFSFLTALLGVILLTGVITYAYNQKKSRERNTIPWFHDEEATALLISNGHNKPLTVSQLPARHKTLGIRFQAFKAQVCRPFSQ
jgi:hypothetical protein